MAIWSSLGNPMLELHIVDHFKMLPHEPGVQLGIR
jgi:hypothetical protein